MAFLRHQFPSSLLLKTLTARAFRSRSLLSLRRKKLLETQHCLLENLVNLEVDYESEEKASIVYSTLAVDEELQPDKVKRHMSVSNGKLSVGLYMVAIYYIWSTCNYSSRNVDYVGHGFKSIAHLMDLMHGNGWSTVDDRNFEEEHDGFLPIAYSKAIILDTCVGSTCSSTPVKKFEAVEARFLRASYSAFMDVLAIATKTMEEFSPGTK
ncbi:CTAG/Pcc1 family, partial [Dillenia turbinata]